MPTPHLDKHVDETPWSYNGKNGYAWGPSPRTSVPHYLMVLKRERFFQWVCHPEIEEENNFAERYLRSLVIAIKIPIDIMNHKRYNRERHAMKDIIETDECYKFRALLTDEESQGKRSFRREMRFTLDFIG